MMKNYPSFLKNEPLIWGITMSDIFKLTMSMFVLSFLNIPQEIILFLVVLIYGVLILLRKLYPRRHFEFLFKREKVLRFFSVVKIGRNKK